MIQRLLLISLFALGTAGAVLAQDARTHTVKAGDTLYHIAISNDMSVDALKRLNSLSDDVIQVGQVLLLSEGVESVERVEPTSRAQDLDTGENVGPTSSDLDDVPVERVEPTAADDDTVAAGDAADNKLPEGEDVSGLVGDEAVEDLARSGVSTYTVEDGETLYSIAAELGTQAYVLFTLNEGVREPLEPGTSIVIPAFRRAASYEVKRGDTLSEIARDHGTTVAAVRRANALASDQLNVGQRLTIPESASSSSTPASSDTQRTYAVGTVAVFPSTYAGRVMAGGAAYDPEAFVVAHRELPFDTVLIIENAETGRASFGRVADRGPLDERRLMEISSALATEIGVDSGGRVRVRLVE